MARYRAAVDTRGEREDVFACLSDFSTAQEWDPGVVEAKRPTDSAIGEGTEFRLVAEFLGRESTLTYRIVEFDPPDVMVYELPVVPSTYSPSGRVLAREHGGFEQKKAGRLTNALTPEPTAKAAA